MKNIYTCDDIANSIIIDITGDQFDEFYPKVYVGKMDEFHNRFKVIQIFDFKGFEGYENECKKRLVYLYEIIISEMQY